MEGKEGLVQVGTDEKTFSKGPSEEPRENYHIADFYELKCSLLKYVEYEEWEWHINRYIERSGCVPYWQDALILDSSMN